jgi:hypothetical protein
MRIISTLGAKLGSKTTTLMMQAEITFEEHHVTIGRIGGEDLENPGGTARGA